MENTKTEELTGFAKKEWLKAILREYLIKIIFTSGCYAGLTLYLNSIRTTASLWIVWVLIAIQLLLYSWIFTKSYLSSKELGYQYGIIPFAILAVLGRTNDWELVIIPLTIIITILMGTREIKKVKN